MRKNRWYHKLWPWCQIIDLTNRINTIRDYELPLVRRPYEQYWRMEWMKVHNEICILHAALRRKNRRIEALKKMGRK